MSASRLELKVGMFVVVLLGLGAIMTLRFSETGFGLTKTKPLQLRSVSAGAVVVDSPVQMSGVKIGVVEDIVLDAQQGGVVIHVGIFEQHWSLMDSHTQFSIRATGLMGDQFVAAIPGETKGDTLQPGAEMTCEAPFDLTSVARDAQQLIRRVDKSMATLDGAINRLDQTLLSSNSIGDLTSTIAEIKKTAEHVRSITGSINTNTVPRINQFVEFLADNTPKLKEGLDDFTRFTKRLDGYADDLGEFAATNKVVIVEIIDDLKSISGTVDSMATDLNATYSANRDSIDEIITNVKTVTADLKQFTEKSNKILDAIDKEEGLAGGLLKNEKLREDFMGMVAELKGTAKSIKELAEHLKAKGLLHKPPKTDARPPPRSGRPQ